jgi:hypothetical protein
MDKPSSILAHHTASSSQWIQKITNLEHYYNAKVQGGSLLVTQNPAVHFGSRPAMHVAIRDLNDTCTALHLAKDMSTRWVPPSLMMTEDIDNYPTSGMERDGSL